MTREEERSNAAEQYVEGFHSAIQRMCKESFVDGVKWADLSNGTNSNGWSSEDEEMKRAIIDNIFILKKMFRKEEMQTDYNRMIEWVKSLKQRMEE